MGDECKKYEKRFLEMRHSKTSYMNDTKWIKLLQALENFSNETSVGGVILKFLMSDKTQPHYFSDGVLESEKCTGDGWCGPICLKAIEWFFVPAAYEVERYSLYQEGKKIPSLYVENDIIALKNIIDSVGLFEYDIDQNGLKLYGYK